MAKKAPIARLSEEIEEKAFELAAEGETFEVIAEKMQLANERALSRYRKTYPEFEEDLNEAAKSYDAHLEAELLSIPHKYDKDTARLLSTNIIKVLEYRNPSRYSPRQQHDLNISIDISGALERASNRIIDVTNVVPMLKGKKE